jgi:parallel beta-helix repeat protein
MRRLSCSVLVGVLVLAAGALAEEALACTVTVQPGQSIQAAIAGAQEGAVICLGEGSWQENLKIEKALTLRGQGAQKTVIDGIQEGYPVVWVVGAQPIEVRLEGLGVTGAEGGCANWPEICAHGVLIQGTAQAKINSSTISGNRDDGILLGGSAQAEIADSTISKNSSGIGLSGSAQAKITGSTISENWGIGILLLDTAQAEITNNLIRGNGWAGIVSSSDGPVTGSKNRMQENGVDLVGNLPAGLRLPLVEATKQEIRLPDPAYPSLQHAVDALLPGGRLILGKGAYVGGVTIEKDLTLEALEGAEARLKGGAAVISLVGAARVKLAGLLLGDRLSAFGLAGGATVQVEISGSTISGNSFGIELRGTARAEITSSTISGNGFAGIWLRGTAQAKITGSTISKNGGNGGIVLEDSARAEITNSTISENEWRGIGLEDSAQAEITSSTISKNGAGISLGDTAQAKITGSTISGNRGAGIELVGPAQAEITTSTISDNGADGILLLERAILRLTESHLLRNQGYGVRAYLPGCVEDSQSALRFTGEVSGRGNTIPGPAEPEGKQERRGLPRRAGLPHDQGGRQVSLKKEGVSADD